MKFDGFTQHDFNVFTIPGLDGRMQGIQERIQPKFQGIGEVLVEDVQMMSGSEMYLHIAKHARRTVNPPKDTWLAIAANKRGYKQHPHFQIGLFDDRVFIWLAYIYEVPGKDQMANTFLKNQKQLKQIIPADYVISQDHYKKEADKFGELDLEHVLTRFRDVKKAELLIGRHLFPGDPILADGERFLEFARETFETLMPIYQLSFK